jgi:hypothetical protein
MFSTDAGHTFLSVEQGNPKGAASPFWHTTLLARSSVLCLSSDWREKLRCCHVGGAVLSDRKTGRDFRAVSEKFTARFHKEDGIQPSSLVLVWVG